jgi:aerobic C4-dicarboxylate transport protein
MNYGPSPTPLIAPDAVTATELASDATRAAEQDQSRGPRGRPGWWRSLYLQVLFAIVAGCILGWLAPAWGVAMKPLGDGFIKLIKMMIGPIIFTSIVSGIGMLGDLRRLGRVGWKALVYFEAVTTLALVIGLFVVNIVKPGVGLHAVPTATDAANIGGYTRAASETSSVDFVMHIIPATFAGAFTSGEILQVLFVAILIGVALSSMGERAAPVVQFVNQLGEAFMKIIGLLMKLAPLAAFGAMAFTIGKFGLDALFQLAGLLVCVYVTCIAFVVIVLGAIMRAIGFNLWQFLRYIREEILLVLGTSSSESALPRMFIKMERLGCERSVVGLVLPMGYSFNLDGTSIYLTMAAIFVAQATDTPLDFGQQVTVLLMLLLTSKGAAAVTGGGFVTLSATLTSVGTIPVSGLSLLLGVDRFMSEMRAITNLIGNGVAVLVVSRWENALDTARAHQVLECPSSEAAP